MLLRDLEADIVLNDIVHWIEHPAAPLPSGADRRPVTEVATNRRGSVAAQIDRQGGG